MGSENYRKILKEILKGRDKENKANKENYAFYNFNLKHKGRMIVGQNPGGFGKNERGDIDSTDNPEKLVEIYQGVLIHYFNKGKMKKFWEKFFNTLNQSLNLKINPLEFFKEKNIFYTDIIKKRGNIKKLTEEDKEIFEEIFEDELNFVNPKLIICFGGISWDFFKEKHKKNIVRVASKTNRGDVGGIVKEHGHLFKIQEGKYIIPLIHYSNNSYPKCPRESYWDYFKEGLKEYNELPKKDKMENKIK